MRGSLVGLPSSASQHPDVVALLRDTGETDPRLAIRRKVEGVIDRLRRFGEPQPPFDMTLLASLLGIRLSEAPPAHSEDAEIAPGRDGHLELRLNQERPEVRRRFSVGHEIGHTFFPGYEQSVQTRKPTKRDWSDPADVVEHLCDCAASELLFPLPWFADDVRGRARTASSLVTLADDYKASREAMLRRYAEIHEEAVAVVFLGLEIEAETVRRLERFDCQRDAARPRSPGGGRDQEAAPRGLRNHERSFPRTVYVAHTVGQVDRRGEHHL